MVCKLSKSYNNVTFKNSKGQFFLNSNEDSDTSESFYNIYCEDRDGPFYIKLKVENTYFKFEIDTGSKISAISKYCYDQHFSNISLQKKSLKLRSYTGNLIESLGFILVKVNYGTFSGYLELFVIENGGPPLLGRSWIRYLNLNLCYKNNFN